MRITYITLDEVNRFLVQRSVYRLRVSAGRGRRDDADDGAVGAGVPVPLKPPPPVLVGKDAKTVPTGDDDANRSDLAA